MVAQMGERVLAPLLGSLTGIGRGFTAAGFGEGVAQKLVLAGNPPSLNVDKILVLKLLGIVSVVLWIPIVLALNFQGILAVVAVLVLWGSAFMYPDILISRKIEDRQKEIARKLPDILD